MPMNDEAINLPGDSRPDFSRWLIAFAVMSSAVMEVLDTSVVNVSLPHMAGSLSSTVDEATWVLTSYIVANAIILPITGWLAGIFGRKRLLMIVVTGFTLSSVLCGLAPNLPLLIFFRVLQGTTGGGLQPLSQAVLLDEFPGRERGKAMGFWGLGIVAAPILGPTLGGWITDSYSWRWVFYINLPVGILSLIMIYLYVHDPHHIKSNKAVRIDAIGLAMLAIGMGSLQVMLDKGQEEDWFGSRLIVTLAILALVFLAAFVFRELRTPDPIVRFRLLRYRNFATGIIAGMGPWFCALWQSHPASAVYANLAGLDGDDRRLLDEPPRHRDRAADAGGRLHARQRLGRALDARTRFYRCRPGVVRVLDHDAAVRHLGHFLLSGQPGPRPLACFCAADDINHGPDPKARDGVCDEPLQRYAEYRLQHGDFVCDNLAGASVAIPPISPGIPCDSIQPSIPADGKPDLQYAFSSRDRFKYRRESGSGLDLWQHSAAGIAPELCGSLLRDWDRVAGLHFTDPAHAPFETSSRRIINSSGIGISVTLPFYTEGHK